MPSAARRSWYNFAFRKILSRLFVPQPLKIRAMRYLQAGSLEADDIKALLSWLDWAYEEVSQ